MMMRFMIDYALQGAWLSEAYRLAGRLDEAYIQALPGRARRPRSQAQSLAQEVMRKCTEQ